VDALIKRRKISFWKLIYRSFILPSLVGDTVDLGMDAKFFFRKRLAWRPYAVLFLYICSFCAHSSASAKFAVFHFLFVPLLWDPFMIAYPMMYA